MSNPVVWIGGWASNLACWRADLEILYPGREHTFLDAHAILSEPGLLPLIASTLPAKGTIVAWSLGSLLLHQSLATGDFQPSCHLVSICPIFDFCREGGPWPPAALFRMARKLPKNRQAVLTEFYDQVQGDSPITPIQAEAWKLQSHGYSLTTLLEGLEALGGIRVARLSLPSYPKLSFLASAHDPLAPPTREDFPALGWTGYSHGHLPFLDYPELLRPLLGGRFQSESR
jgi:hypothetical protein